MTRLLLFLFCLSGAAQATDADAILGSWMTRDNESRVEIYKDGKGYAGKIADIEEKVYGPEDQMAGKPKIDRENPDKSKRNRPIIGMVLMEGFKFKKDQWSGGTIYDPESGKTYKCKMKLTDPNTLEVRGFIGFALLGRTEVWTRPAK